MVLLNNAGWDCFKTAILREILRIQNPLWVEHCAFLEVIHSYPQVGYAGSKHLSHTVQRMLRLFLSMQVYAWMGSLLSIFGIWLLMCSSLHLSYWRNPKEESRETCRVTPHQTSTPMTKPRLQFSTTIMNWAISIMFHPTRSLLNLVRCSTFLRMTKQWFKWSSKAEPTELLLIVCVTELIWITNFRSGTSTPNINLQTYWQREQRTRNFWISMRTWRGRGNS